MYVLTGLLAGRFTRRASKLADAQTVLADTVDAPASKSEWGRNARINSNDSAGRFVRRNCEQIGRFPIRSPTLPADLPIPIRSPMLPSRSAHSDSLANVVGGSAYSDLLACLLKWTSATSCCNPTSFFDFCLSWQFNFMFAEYFCRELIVHFILYYVGLPTFVADSYTFPLL